MLSIMDENQRFMTLHDIPIVPHFEVYYTTMQA